MIVALIPAYNAVHTIAEVIFRTQEFVDVVVVCDDGSTDDTYFVASKCGARVLKHGKNFGKGGALDSLFGWVKGYASDKKLENIISVTLDADMQHSPKDIPKIVNPILKNESDVVLGIRKGIPKHRSIGNRILNIVSGRSVDTECGFRAYNLRAVERIKITTEGFGADTEILDCLEGLRIKTVSVSTSYGKHSHTKNIASHFVEVFNFLFLKRPLRNLGIAGGIAFMIGLFTITEVVRRWNVYKELAIGNFLFGIMVLLLGALTFFVGVILHVIKGEIKR